jgi:hypothetical protein
MADEKVYKGVIGLAIIIDLEQDISTATTKQIKVLHNGVETVWTAEVYDTTKLRYITASADDLATPGTYYLQPYLVFPSGFNPHCNTVELFVYDDYE